MQRVKPSVFRVALLVLKRSHTPHGSERGLALFVTSKTTELKLPSRIEAIDEAATSIARLCSHSGMSEEATFGVDMAVREAIANAIIHGNQLDESKLVEVIVTSSPDSLEIKVHDQGAGFNPEAVADPTAEENLLKSSGRGIFFVRNFMDEVYWLTPPEGGTTVRMIKKTANA